MFDPSVPEERRLDRLETHSTRLDTTRLDNLTPLSLGDEEARRQEILHSYQLLDTAPESSYDDLANMAALICATPIALVTLISQDRQWFKARVGLELQETPRDQSFCAHAIRDPAAILEVQDARNDARFKDNPLVVGEPGIRFYAGAPLLSPSGVALGTVCVIDRVPRQLTPAMALGLQALARQTGELMALRRANADLETLNRSVMEMQVELEQYHVKLEGENADLNRANPIDPVTGLNNQRAFEQVLEGELDRAQRTGSRLALLLADIDLFDVFAKDFGAVARDDALRRVAKVLKAQARGYDTLACIDARRFALLLPGTDDAELAVVATRLRVAVAFMQPVGRGLRVSIGVAVARPIDAPLDMLHRATVAAEQATKQGGNQVVVEQV